MPSGYHHLTYGERCRTCALRKSGLSDPAIARQLCRDRTTVCREIRRNGGGREYRHGPARDMGRLRPADLGRAARSLRKWPVLHFGVEVGGERRRTALPPDRECGAVCARGPAGVGVDGAPGRDTRGVGRCRSTLPELAT